MLIENPELFPMFKATERKLPFALNVCSLAKFPRLFAKVMNYKRIEHRAKTKDKVDFACD